jgi:hypothetical protein
VIVSDLHLSAAGRPGYFDQDSAFAGFLARLQLDASSTTIRLILLGDTFDFPSVPSLNGHLRDHDADLVDRLNRILESHGEFVQALRDFAGSGNRLHFLPGNHDLALMRPAVQDALTAVLGEIPAGNLAFHPWNLFIPDVLYAEHGNQYHDINSFPEWLKAEVLPLHEVKAPIGLKLDEFIQVLSGKNSGAANGQPASANTVIRGQLRHPLTLVRTFPVLLAFGLGAGLEALAVNSPTRNWSRRNYRTACLVSAPERMNLPSGVLIEIDRLAERNGRAWPARLRRSALRTLRARGKRGSVNTGGIVSVAMTEAQRRDHFRDMGSSIADTLTKAGIPVPVYAFGHTHIIDRWQSSQRTVVNAGSWLVTSQPSENIPTSLSFIQVDVDPADGQPQVALRTWNDSLQEVREWTDGFSETPSDPPTQDSGGSGR